MVIALQKTYPAVKINLNLENAYHVLMEVTQKRWGSRSVDFLVGIFANYEAFRDGKDPIVSEFYHVNDTGVDDMTNLFFKYFTYPLYVVREYEVLELVYQYLKAEIPYYNDAIEITD